MLGRVVGVREMGADIAKRCGGDWRRVQVDMRRGGGSVGRVGGSGGGAGAGERGEREGAAVVVGVCVAGGERGQPPVLFDEGEHRVERCQGVVDERPFRVWADDDHRDPYAETAAVGRCDVVVEAATVIVGDEEDSGVPLFAWPVHDRFDKRLDVVVANQHRCVVVLTQLVVRDDGRVGGEPSGGRIREEPRGSFQFGFGRLLFVGSYRQLASVGQIDQM